MSKLEHSTEHKSEHRNIKSQHYPFESRQLKADMRRRKW